MVVVTDTHPDIVSYVDSLQRKNAEQVSFYPRCVFEREIIRKRILLLLLNDQPCGYIYHGSLSDDVKCHQVCIQYDARRRLYGAALVSELEGKATRSGSYTVTLRCGFDLEANEFWKSLGYRCIDVQNGGVRRMRRINVWQKILSPLLIEPPELQAESGITSASVWRSTKRVGIVNQFVRGRRMLDYRLLIERNHDNEDCK